MRKLSDPKYTKVLEEFQKDPKAAMIKYARDRDVAEFFKSFMGIFGEHFSNFTVPSQSQTDETSEPLIQEVKPSENKQVITSDELKMRDILSRPEVKNCIQNEDVKKLFDLMRNSPDEAQRFLFEKRTDSTFQSHVNVLCENGLLQFAT